jgi:uncharacterized protein YoxC
MTMRTLLIVLTVVEIALFLGVVAGYLVVIERSLARTAKVLGKVAFGVRAIEKQTDPLGARVTRVNEQLSGIAAALDRLATLADGRDGRTRATSRPLRAGEDV